MQGVSHWRCLAVQARRLWQRIGWMRVTWRKMDGQWALASWCSQRYWLSGAMDSSTGRPGQRLQVWETSNTDAYVVVVLMHFSIWASGDKQVSPSLFGYPSCWVQAKHTKTVWNQNGKYCQTWLSIGTLCSIHECRVRQLSALSTTSAESICGRNEILFWWFGRRPVVCSYSSWFAQLLCLMGCSCWRLLGESNEKCS